MTYKILETLINENDRRLQVIMSEDIDYVCFRAAIAPTEDDGEWTEREFPDHARAKDWLNQTATKKERARRTEYAFPVTVRTEGGLHTPCRHQDATLRGLNATDGEWEVTLGTNDKHNVESDVIFRRMTPDDATNLDHLKAEERRVHGEIRDLENKYNLALPHSYGRTKVDDALKIDEGMVSLFEREESDE